MVKEYICECHGKKWQSVTHLRIHLNSKRLNGEPRSDKRDHICDQCNKKLKGGWYLNRHKRQVHPLNTLFNE